MENWNEGSGCALCVRDMIFTVHFHVCMCMCACMHVVAKINEYFNNLGSNHWDDLFDVVCNQGVNRSEHSIGSDYNKPSLD